MKNLKIIYLLSFLFRSWFWLGIWLLYYLHFTDYVGISILELSAILATTLSEIPAGAVSDLLGKRKTLMITFVLAALGNFLLGYAPSFAILILSVVIISMADAFYSGTVEALLYDSLKDDKKEGHYDKALSKTNTFGFIASAFASVVGGFIYQFNISYPFYLVTLFYLCGFIISFFLKEPNIDTEKFSWASYKKQTVQGFNQLFKNQAMKKLSYFLIITAAFSVFAYQILIDLLMVEFGFNGMQIGILVSAIFVISALASQATSFLTQKFQLLKLIFIINFLIAISFMMLSKLHLYYGAIAILFWAALNTLCANLSSIALNKKIVSRYRATTISTLTMLAKLPYIFGAVFIGQFMQIYSAKFFALIMGSLILILSTIFFIPLKTKN